MENENISRNPLDTRHTLDEKLWKPQIGVFLSEIKENWGLLPGPKYLQISFAGLVTKMGRDEKIRGAQEILDWVVMRLNLSITCKVMDYKHENYRVQILKGGQSLIQIQVTEESVKDSNPKENSIPDRLETLLRNLDNY